MQHFQYQILSLALAFASASAYAADHDAIVPYLGDDVVAVAYLDLEKVDVSAAIEELSRLNIIPAPEQEVAKKNAAAMQAMYAELPKRGAQRLYALLRVSDVMHGGPTWVIEVGKEGDAPKVAELLSKWFDQPTPEGTGIRAFSDFIFPKKFEVVDGAVVATSSDAQLKGVKERVAAAPLAGLDGADAGVVVFGDADSRRVVREMFPQLPAPFMEIDGKLLADGLRWGGVKLTLPPSPSLALMAETATPEVAVTLSQAVDKASVVAKAFLMKESLSELPVHRDRAKSLLPLLSLLAPKVEATRITLAFGDDEQEIAFVRDFLPAMTQGMRDSAYRSSRVNQFKQIALGMLNHESAKQAYPAAASYDPSGRPLLSWRVHILPYVEQQALYNQFRLDEPWNSEHNRKLIEQMPEIYADPDSNVRAAIGDQGRTSYVVPVGEGLMFGSREGMKIKEVTDGTSNTILAVEVVPERAVVWTKPDDWVVDLANPLAGVQRKDRNGFVAAWCDGSVRHMGNDNDPATLKSLLTPQGGELIKHNDIK